MINFLKSSIVLGKEYPEEGSGKGVFILSLLLDKTRERVPCKNGEERRAGLHLLVQRLAQMLQMWVWMNEQEGDAGKNPAFLAKWGDPDWAISDLVMRIWGSAIQILNPPTAS